MRQVSSSGVASPPTATGPDRPRRRLRPDGSNRGTLAAAPVQRHASSELSAGSEEKDLHKKASIVAQLRLLLWTYSIQV